MTLKPLLRWHELPHAPPVGTVLCKAADIGDGQVLMHTITHHSSTAAQTFGVLLMRSGSEVKAFANRCAHFGVPLAAKQAHLRFEPHTSITCNVHYARYRWTDGVCDQGDCEGESLVAIPVVVDADGTLCIADTGHAPLACPPA